MTLAADHAAALDFLYGRINYEQTSTVPYRSRELNLERMRQLLNRLDNPHQQYPIVHVAGTKGKGSTAAMLSSILASAGFRCGKYTSPHLNCLEERFALNGRSCSQEDLILLVNLVRPAVEQLDRAAAAVHDRPTFFEITTAIAFVYFALRRVDIAVIEVGLGGRLDSTNVCQPLVSVITSISFDHTQQLGNTLDAIAREKAGIIKPGVPVVTGVTAPEPLAAIVQIAEERGCPLFRFGQDFVVKQRSSAVGQPPRFDYLETNVVDRSAIDPSKPSDRGAISDHPIANLQLALLGQHQADNAAVALATIGRLREAGWAIPDEACRSGLSKATCPARIEIVGQKPDVILDTAHNVASIDALLQTLREHFPGRPRILIMAVARDKDVAGILQRLLPEFDKAILTQFTSSQRGLPLEELYVAARRVGAACRLVTAAHPTAAWLAAKPQSNPDTTFVITGSFFLAAEMREILRSSI